MQSELMAAQDAIPTKRFETSLNILVTGGGDPELRAGREKLDSDISGKAALK